MGDPQWVEKISKNFHNFLGPEATFELGYKKIPDISHPNIGNIEARKGDSLWNKPTIVVP